MNITYLLGAGASYNALPVIDELPERLLFFEKKLEETKNFLPVVKNKPNHLKTDDIQKLMTSVQWLLKEMSTHKTVDTLAKKFYVMSQRETDLVLLKKTLIAYFLFEQRFATSTIGNKAKGTERVKEMPDKRYDTLIATIISKERNNLNLDPKFKVITWNYDSQIELAYRNYSEKGNFKFIQQKLQTFPSESSKESRFRFNESKFGIIKLNGVAGFLSADVFDTAIDLTNHAEIQVHVLGTIAYKFVNMSDEELSLFNYSWESKEQFSGVHSEKQTLVETAQQIMKETNILIVIGYSFPNFNRSVDKVLLSELKGLKKVYVQDVNAEEVCELIKSSFELFKWSGSKEFDVDFRTKTNEQVPIIPVKGVDQFFIPPEADI